MSGAVAEATAGVRKLRRAEFPELLREIHDPPRGLYPRAPVVVWWDERGFRLAPLLFSASNRIIAGLAAATVIVEARERSGALITADFALEDGREVFAVPGEITGSLATGTNRLLRQGATPLTSAADVLEMFGLGVVPAARSPTLGEAARRVLDRLAESSATADELARATGFDASPLAAALTELELAGLVGEADGRYRGVRPPN